MKSTMLKIGTWMVRLLLTGMAAVICIILAGRVTGVSLIGCAMLAHRRTEPCKIADAYRLLKERSQVRPAATSKIIQTEGSVALVEVNGQRWWVPSRNAGMVPVMVSEVDAYENNTVSVRAGDVVFDCGANVGMFTRRALRAGARRVVAVEIAPENVECLRRNFAPEIETGTVVVYPKGVWNGESSLRLHVSPLSATADSVVVDYAGAGEGPLVPLTTMDHIVEELGIERVDFIKMDIEGAEREALAGGRQVLARFHPRMIVSTEHNQDDLEAIPRQILTAWPGASVTCGPCTIVHTERVMRMQPEVVYVR